MTLHTATFLTAEFGDILKGLFVLFILFGPLLKKIFERGEDKPGQRMPQKPRTIRPPAQEPSVPTTGGVITWQDVLAGRGREETVEPPLAEEALHLPGMEPHEHEQLMPDRILGDLPSESELERHGGDHGAPLVHPTGLESLHGFSSGEDELGGGLGDRGELAGLHEFDEWEEAAVARKRVRNPWRPDAGDWKRSIVIAEVLGSPLGMRKEQRHPGPPLGLL